MAEITKEQLVELLTRTSGWSNTACVQYTQHQRAEERDVPVRCRRS